MTESRTASERRAKYTAVDLDVLALDRAVHQVDRDRVRVVRVARPHDAADARVERGREAGSREGLDEHPVGHEVHGALARIKCAL